MSVLRILNLDASNYVSHALHDSARHWPQTNCYVDLWIELLHSYKFDAHAMLPFCATIDFEGDQWTFFKPSYFDLETLYGLEVLELAIYDNLESHAKEQMSRGHVVLVEFDSLYLPDTKGTAYQHEHVKTTVALNHLDAAERRLGYFHNAGYYTLSNEDYDGVFRKTAALRQGDILFPYVEFVKRRSVAHVASDLRTLSKASLEKHLKRAPKENPFEKFAARFRIENERLVQSPQEAFHLYTFNNVRQFGSAFELFAAYANWLKPERSDVAVPFLAMAEIAKALQFQLARSVAKKKVFDSSSTLASLGEQWQKGQVLAQRLLD